jgi:acetyl/propionyl-CoA carboxylase alpha subunit
MNTRLQVEHPVTEEITGLDLVEWQIRIAEGERLPLKQDQVTAKGSAIEVRLNAEDPARGYRPCIGTVELFETPSAEGVRVDTGIRPGSVVTPNYDSMLAKVIAHAPNRAEAAARLSTALGDLAVLGIGSNQAFLRDIVDHPVFRAGELSTSFLPEVYPDGWQPKAGGGDADIAAAVLWADISGAPKAPGPWSSLGGFRVSGQGWIALALEQNGETARLELSGGHGRYQIRRDGAAVLAEASVVDCRLTLSVGSVRRTYAWAARDERIWIGHDALAFEFTVRPWIETAGGSAGGAASGGGNRVLASMPGQISAIKVEIGQTVTGGETVAVLEAMKLLYSLPAPVAGTVAAVYAVPGDNVAAGAVLVEIEPEG